MYEKLCIHELTTVKQQSHMLTAALLHWHPYLCQCAGVPGYGRPAYGALSERCYSPKLLGSSLRSVLHSSTKGSSRPTSAGPSFKVPPHVPRPITQLSASCDDLLQLKADLEQQPMTSSQAQRQTSEHPACTTDRSASGTHQDSPRRSTTQDIGLQNKQHTSIEGEHPIMVSQKCWQ